MLSSASRALTIILAAASALACSPGGDVKRPNIVLTIIDTLRADKLSSYGYPSDTSPALTRLSEQGVQFDSVISQTSWTMPSVGSMLTSQYPRTLGLYSEDAQKVPDSAELLAETLQRAGYATFGITANPNLNERYNFHQGFDEYHESLVVFRKSRDEVPEGKTFFRDAALRTAPEITIDVLDFADRVDGSMPCFVLIDLMEVHEYFNGKLRRPEYDKLFEGEPSAPYLQMVRQVTDDLAVLVEQLSAKPGWEDTLFVFTSDHGEGLLDHPSVASSRGHGSLLYGSHVHVPWIMYNPSWQPKRSRIEQRVRLLDLVPTLLDYAGVEASGDYEGISLMPLIEGEVEELPMPPYLITETYFRDLRKVSAIGDEWQLIHNRRKHEGLPRLELQGLDGKPDGAKTDQSAEHADAVQEMREFIRSWEAEHQRAKATKIEEELDEATRAQLQAVGYLGGDEEDEGADETEADGEEASQSDSH